MTREQIEGILKNFGAKSDKEGVSLPEGSNVTIHVSHDGATLQFAKVESIKFDGELVYARSAKQSIGLVGSDVFAVAIEGGGGAPARRPAGFL